MSSLDRSVLAMEVLVGSLVLVAAILTVRRWAWTFPYVLHHSV
jgi:hypothetical protein